MFKLLLYLTCLSLPIYTVIVALSIVTCFSDLLRCLFLSISLLSYNNSPPPPSRSDSGSCGGSRLHSQEVHCHAPQACHSRTHPSNTSGLHQSPPLLLISCRATVWTLWSCDTRASCGDGATPLEGPPTINGERLRTIARAASGDTGRLQPIGSRGSGREY